MDVVVKEGVVVGDAVLLSCRDSASILKVRDVDGCQIRLDGEVTRVEGEWCKVLVRLEAPHKLWGLQEMTIVLSTRVKDVDVTGGSCAQANP